MERLPGQRQGQAIVRAEQCADSHGAFWRPRPLYGGRGRLRFHWNEIVYLGLHSEGACSMAVQMRACAYSSPRIEVRRYRIL